MSKIRVAIAGVGNCASSLIQGVEYYKDAVAGEVVPGLMHVELGGYHVSDLEFVAAFDVDAAKVGQDLAKAIFCSQNNTIRFAEVPDVGIEVQRGPTLDGLNKYYREMIEESPAAPVEVVHRVRLDEIQRRPARPRAGARLCETGPRRDEDKPFLAGGLPAQVPDPLQGHAEAGDRSQRE